MGDNSQTPDISQIADMVKREISGSYNTTELRAAYRAGLSTASAICDRVSKVAEGKTVAARAQVLAAKICGDQIWQIRESIHVDRPTPITTEGGGENG